MDRIDERLAADPAVTEQYDRLLAAIGDVAPQIRDRLVTPFFPEVGSDYRGLVIVGQSTWGWEGEQAPREYATPEGRAEALAYAKRVHRDREEPMSWLEERKRNASAPFWAVTRRLAERFEPDSTAPWYGRFAWANLYPVSWQWPEPGNPGGPLRAAQDHLVAGLLAATLHALDAKRVVIYAGGYWWPTGWTPPFDGLGTASKPLKAVGRIGDMAVVVGYHPAGAQRSGTSREAYAALLGDALERT
jgi:hypothetical protein